MLIFWPVSTCAFTAPEVWLGHPKRFDELVTAEPP
jgi:hypothetical protein